MAIETVTQYNPSYTLPLYIVIKRANRAENGDVGDKFDIRIEDKERQDEKGGKGPYNYMHESILIAQRICKWRELKDITKAYLAHSRDREDVHSFTHPSEDGEWKEDDEVMLRVFIRLDAARDFIINDEYVQNKSWIPDYRGEIDIEDYEGNE